MFSINFQRCNLPIYMYKVYIVWYNRVQYIWMRWYVEVWATYVLHCSTKTPGLHTVDGMHLSISNYV